MRDFAPESEMPRCSASGACVIPSMSHSVIARRSSAPGANAASSRVESYRRLPHLVSHEACPAVLRRPEILGVLRRALSEDPEGRYESAAEFEQDLRQALHERALGNVVQNVRVHLDGGALRSHA